MIELCHTSELPEGTSKGFSLSSGNIFLVKKNQQIYAFRNSCPHLGIPLEWVANKFLDEEGELIQCATHGALFTIENGSCVYGPCVNQSLTRVSVVEKRGTLYVVSP